MKDSSIAIISHVSGVQPASNPHGGNQAEFDILPGEPGPVAKYHVHALVLRAAGGYRRAAYGVEGLELSVGDIVITDSMTTVTIELLIGGLIRAQPGSRVKLTEGPVMVLRDGEWQKVVNSRGGAWAKFCKENRPLTILSRGGVMGIKG